MRLLRLFVLFAFICPLFTDSFSHASDRIGLYGFYLGQSLEEAIENIRAKDLHISQYYSPPSSLSLLPPDLIDTADQFKAEMTVKCQNLTNLAKEGVIPHLAISNDMCISNEQFQMLIKGASPLTPANFPLSIFIQADDRPAMRLLFIQETESYPYSLYEINIQNDNLEVAEKMYQTMTRRFGHAASKTYQSLNFFIWTFSDSLAIGARFEPNEQPAIENLEIIALKPYEKLILYWHNQLIKYKNRAVDQM